MWILFFIGVGLMVVEEAEEEQGIANVPTLDTSEGEPGVTAARGKKIEAAG